MPYMMPGKINYANQGSSAGAGFGENPAVSSKLGGAKGGSGFGSGDFVAGVAFRVSGADTTAAQLANMSSQFKQVQNSASGALLGTNAQMDQLTRSGAFDQVKSFAIDMEQWSGGILGSMYQRGKELVTMGDSFAGTRRGFLRVFKDETLAAEKFKEALAIAEKTSLSTDYVLSGATKLARLNVDPFKTYKAEVMPGVEGNLTAMELMNDLVSSTGQAQNMLMIHFSRALTGQSRNFKAMFDGAENNARVTAAFQGKTAEEMFKNAKTEQERADVILTTINTLYGGASAAAAGTFGFLQANLKDVLTNVKSLIGEDLAPKLAVPMQKLFDILSSFKDNKKMLSALTSAVGSLVDKFVLLMDAGIKGLEWVLAFIQKYPELTGKILSAVAAVAVLTFGMSKLLGVSTSIGQWFYFVLPTLKKFATAGIAAFGGLLPVALGVAAAIGLIAGAIYAYQENIGGIADTLAIVTDAVEGVWQLIKSYHNGMATMDTDLGQKLADGGVFQWVVNVGMWLGSLKEYVVDALYYVKDNASRIWDSLRPGVEAAWQFLQTVGGAIMQYVGALFAGLGLSIGDGTEKGLAGFQHGFAQFTEWIKVKSEEFAVVLGDVGQVITQLKPVFIGLGIVAAFMYRLWAAVSSLFMQAVSPAFKILYNVGYLLAQPFILVGNLVSWMLELFGFLVPSLGATSGEIDWLGTAINWLLIPVKYGMVLLEALAWVAEKIGDAFRWAWDQIDLGVQKFKGWIAEVEGLSDTISTLMWFIPGAQQFKLAGWAWDQTGLGGDGGALSGAADAISNELIVRKEPDAEKGTRISAADSDYVAYSDRSAVNAEYNTRLMETQNGLLRDQLRTTKDMKAAVEKIDPSKFGGKARTDEAVKNRSLDY